MVATPKVVRFTDVSSVESNTLNVLSSSISKIENLDSGILSKSNTLNVLSSSNSKNEKLCNTLLPEYNKPQFCGFDFVKNLINPPKSFADKQRLYNLYRRIPVKEIHPRYNTKNSVDVVSHAEYGDSYSYHSEFSDLETQNIEFSVSELTTFISEMLSIETHLIISPTASLLSIILQLTHMIRNNNKSPLLISSVIVNLLSLAHAILTTKFGQAFSQKIDVSVLLDTIRSTTPVEEVNQKPLVIDPAYANLVDHALDTSSELSSDDEADEITGNLSSLNQTPTQPSSATVCPTKTFAQIVSNDKRKNTYHQEELFTNLNDLIKQNDDVAITVMSIVAFAFSLLTIAYGFDTSKFLRQLPTSFNFMTSIINSGKTNWNQCRNFIATTFFGEVDAKEALALHVQEYISRLRNFLVVDHTKVFIDPNYLNSFKKCVEEGQNLLIKLERNHPQHNLLTLNITTASNELAKLQNVISTSGIKQTPTALMFIGEPGIGKTTAMLHLASQIGGPNAVYTVDSGDNYFPTYLGQPIMMVQEFARAVDLKEDLIARNLTSIVSPATTNFEGASIEDKRQPCRVQTILLDTNTDPDKMLVATGLQKTSYSAFAERIIWLNCVWTGDDKYMRAPYDRVTRPYNSDFSHIGFYLKYRDSTGAWVKKNWLPYVFPVEFAALQKKCNNRIPLYFDTLDENDPIYSYEFMGRKLSDAITSPMSIAQVQILEEYFRTKHHTTYVANLERSGLITPLPIDSSNLVQQNSRAMSVLFYGLPGQGKTFCINNLVARLSGSPFVFVHNMVKTKHIIPPFKAGHINVIILDDFIPQHHLERVRAEIFVSALYDIAPPNTVFITCTNDIPILKMKQNYFDMNKPYYWGQTSVYNKLYTEPGLHRRAGWYHNFDGIGSFPNKYCWNVVERSYYNEEGLPKTMDQVVENILDGINTLLNSSGKLEVIHTDNMPDIAEMSVVATSLDHLMDSMSLTGFMRTRCGLNPNVKLFCSPDILLKFARVSSCTFNVPRDATENQLVQHFASIVRTTGYTGTLKVTIGKNCYYLDNNNLSVSQGAQLDNIPTITATDITILGYTISKQDAILMAYDPSSLSITNVQHVPLQLHHLFIQAVHDLNDDSDVKRIVYEAKRRKLIAMPIQALDAFKKFLTKFGMPMLYVGVGISCIAVVTHLLNRKAKQPKEIFNKMASGDPDFVEDYKKTDNLEQSSFILKYKFDPRNVTSIEVVDEMDMTRLENQQKKRKYVYVKLRNGTWRRYDKDTGEPMDDGVVVNGEYRKNYWFNDLEDGESPNKAFGRVKQNWRDNGPNFSKWGEKLELDTMDYQALSETYNVPSMYENWKAGIRKNLVNVFSKVGKCYGLAICDRYIIFPAHMITDDKQIIVSFVRNSIRMEYQAEFIHTYDGIDLAMAIMPKQCTAFPDIINKFLPKASRLIGSRFAAEFPRSDTWVELGGTILTEPMDLPHISGTIHNGVGHMLDDDRGTIEGDCGIPYYIEAQARYGLSAIYGIHTHGKKGSHNTVSVFITQEMLYSSIKSIEEKLLLIQTPVCDKVENQKIGKWVVSESNPDLKDCTAKLFLEGIQHGITVSASKIPKSAIASSVHGHKFCVCIFDGEEVVAHNSYIPWKTVLHLFKVDEEKKKLFYSLVKQFFSYGMSDTPMIDMEYHQTFCTLPFSREEFGKSGITPAPFHQQAIAIFGAPGREPVKSYGDFSDSDVCKLLEVTKTVPDQLLYNVMLADTPDIPLDRRLIQSISDSLVRYFEPLIGRYCMFAGDDAALNGLNHTNCWRFPELAFKLKPIELSSSGGFFMRYIFGKRFKGDAIEMDPINGHRKWGKDDCGVLMKQQYNANLTAALNGCAFPSICMTALKDEILPTEKSWRGRVFEISDMATIAVERNVFGYLLAYFSTFSTNHPVRVGMDPLADWHAFEQHHRGLPHHWTADFKRWDKTIPSSLFKILIKTLIHITPDKNWGNACSIVINNIFSSVRHIKNCLVKFNKGNTSGNALTAVLNSLLVYILMFSCFTIITGVSDIVIFNTNVRVSAYGDDLRISVSDQFYKQFNLCDVANVAQKYFGIQMDSDKKDGLLTPECDVDECGFLSRVPKCVNGTYVGALKQDAILGPLYWSKSRLSPAEYMTMFQNLYVEACVWGEDFSNKFYDFYRAMLNNESYRVAAVNNPLCDYNSNRVYLKNLPYTRGLGHSLIFRELKQQSLNITMEPSYTFDNMTLNWTCRFLGFDGNTVCIGTGLSRKTAFQMALDPVGYMNHEFEKLVSLVLKNNKLRSKENLPKRLLFISDTNSFVKEIVYDESIFSQLNIQMEPSRETTTPGIRTMTDSGRMTAINDGMILPEEIIPPSDTLRVNTLVDSQYGNLSTELLPRYETLQQVPVSYEHDAWSNFWNGSHQFIESTISGAEARGYLIMHVSSDPNSPNFPNDTNGSVALIKNFVKAHKFSVTHFIIKMGIASTTGMVGRIITVRVPAGFAWNGTTPTPEEITASGFPYQTTSLDGDQNYEVELKPIVNSGFATASDPANQSVSHVEIWSILETTTQNTFSENPPSLQFKAWLMLGQEFRMTTPTRNLLGVVTSFRSDDNVTSITSPQFITPAQFVINSDLVIGSKNHDLDVTTGPKPMLTEAPIEVFGGTGFGVNPNHVIIATYHPSTGPGNAKYSPYVVAGAPYGGPVPYSSPEIDNYTKAPIDYLNRTYNEVYKFDVPSENLLESLSKNDWNHASYSQERDNSLPNFRPFHSNRKITDKIPVYVGRDAASATYLLRLTGVDDDDYNMILDDQARADIEIPFYASNQRCTPLPLFNYAIPEPNTFLISTTEKGGPMSPPLIDVTTPGITIGAPSTATRAQLYQPLTLTSASPTFLANLGSCAIPNQEHNRLYLFLLSKLRGSSQLRFNITSPNGQVLLNCGFSANGGVVVNSTLDCVQLSSPGPLLINNIVVDSGFIPPSNPTNFNTVLANTALDAFSKLNAQSAALGIGSALGGLGDFFSGYGSMMNQNEQNALNRKLQMDLMQGNIQGRSQLSQQEYEQQLAMAGLTNTNRMMHAGNTPERTNVFDMSSFQQNLDNLNKIDNKMDARMGAFVSGQTTNYSGESQIPAQESEISKIKNRMNNHINSYNRAYGDGNNYKYGTSSYNTSVPKGAQQATITNYGISLKPGSILHQQNMKDNAYLMKKKMSKIPTTQPGNAPADTNINMYGVNVRPGSQLYAIDSIQRPRRSMIQRGLRMIRGNRSLKTNVLNGPVVGSSNC